MNIKNIKPQIIGIGLMLLPIVLYVGNNVHKYKKMKDNPSNAKGMITETRFSPKMGYTISYQFIVEGELYKGSSLKTRKDIYNIGDSCLVIYDKNDISINNLYRDEFGNLSFINKKDFIQEDWDQYLDSLLLEHKAL